MVEFRIQRVGRRVKSKFTNLNFGKAYFGLFKDVLRRALQYKALERREAQESWLILKDHCLQAQEQSIPTNRMPGKMSGWTKCSWSNLNTEKEAYRGWKQRQVDLEEYRKIVQASREKLGKLRSRCTESGQTHQRQEGLIFDCICHCSFQLCNILIILDT